ncbi:hypothetical protein OIO90_004520 [Microbotryomycetes sp. JL221]|nr:hypothetical protein OIO90_004520 [Microbotryomycetes sp. JL221]
MAASSCGAAASANATDHPSRSSSPATPHSRPLTVLTPASPHQDSPHVISIGQATTHSSTTVGRRLDLDRDDSAAQTRAESISDGSTDLLRVPDYPSEPTAQQSHAAISLASPTLSFNDSDVVPFGRTHEFGSTLSPMDAISGFGPAQDEDDSGLPTQSSRADLGPVEAQSRLVTTDGAPPKKLSNTQKLLRKARSFGTSPLLGSSATFGSSSKPDRTATSASPSPSPSPTFGAFPSTSESRLSPSIEHSTHSGSGSASTSTSLSPAHSPKLTSITFANPPLPGTINSGGTKGKGREINGEGAATLRATDSDAGQASSKRKSTFRRSTFSIFRRNEPTAKDWSSSDPPTPADNGPDANQPPVIPPLPSMPTRMSWYFGSSSSPSKSTSSSPVSARIAPPGESPKTRRADLPPFRRSSSTGSPTASIKRDASWSSSIGQGLVASPEMEIPPHTNQTSIAGLRVVETPSGRKVLTRAGRSNSDGPSRGPLPSLSLPPRYATQHVSSSTSDLASMGGLTPTVDGQPRSRPPSPLKLAFGGAAPGHSSLSNSPMRRPLTSDHTLGTSSSSTSSRGGMLSAVAGLFGSGSSSGAASANMSRSSSSTSSSAAGGADASEFGALFGGSSSSKRRRGLSVGDRIFNSTNDTRKRAGSSSSLQNSWVPPANVTSLQVPTPDAVTPMAPSGTRSRASTDPKRLSTTSSMSPGSYFPPFNSDSSPGRPSRSASVSTPPDSVEAGSGGGRRLSFAFGGNSAATKTYASPPASRKASFSNAQTTRSRSTSVKVDIEPGETPFEFVERLKTLVSSAGVLQVLASSAAPFYVEALELYLRTFDFVSDPLDIALRKFLMDSSLPAEAQQIDRVMEALARRYNECNPDLFATSDTPYVLAFSFIMLSTDHFNPNNKNKMSRADYVRNTKIDNISNEVLEYYYDQITMAPFIHVEDENEFGLARPDMKHSSSSLFTKGVGASTSKAKLDPQAYIASGEYRNLRLDIASVIPERSPFSFTGTTSFFNATSLHRLFAQAPILRIETRSRSKASTLPLSATTDGAALAQVQSNTTFVPASRADKSSPDSDLVSSIKVTKIGMLSRKEDLAEGGRKSSSRKWRGWSVILTGSQLLFFKDAPIWAHLLQQELLKRAQQSPSDQVPVFTIQAPFKPDAVLSLAHTAAIYDSTYAKYSNVFRLVAPGGREYLFQTSTKEELNSWLHAINYAASFKSAGVRMRAHGQRRTNEQMSPSLPNAQHDVAALPKPAGFSPSPSSPSTSSFRSGSLPSSQTSSMDDLLINRSSIDSQRGGKGSLGVRKQHSSLDATIAVPTQDDDVETLLKQNQQSAACDSRPDLSAEALKPLAASRADQLRTNICAIEKEIAHVKLRLQELMRHVRNLATLTPFRASTRDRLVPAVPPLERAIRQTRMSLAKLLCHREVLARDLLVEDREDRPVRHGSHRRRNSSRRRGTSPNRTPRPFAHQWSPRRAVIGGSDDTRVDQENKELTNERQVRDSFDSASQDFYDAPQSLTDDELDRLKPPPIMRRSQTETTWTGLINDNRRTRSASTSGPSDDEFVPFARSSLMSTGQDVSPIMMTDTLQLKEDPTTPKVSDPNRKSFDEIVNDMADEVRLLNLTT